LLRQAVVKEISLELEALAGFDNSHHAGHQLVLIPKGQWQTQAHG
jgi:hypothetical protein